MGYRIDHYVGIMNFDLVKIDWLPCVFIFPILPSINGRDRLR